MRQTPTTGRHHHYPTTGTDHHDRYRPPRQQRHDRNSSHRLAWPARPTPVPASRVLGHRVGGGRARAACQCGAQLIRIETTAAVVSIRCSRSPVCAGGAGGYGQCFGTDGRERTLRRGRGCRGACGLAGVGVRQANHGRGLTAAEPVGASRWLMVRGDGQTESVAARGGRGTGSAMGRLGAVGALTMRERRGRATRIRAPPAQR